MEKEILEIFEVAKRAGEAAAAEGGPAQVARCLDALKRLRKLPLTTKELVATKACTTSSSSSYSPWLSSLRLGSLSEVGKSILCLTKNPEKKIQSVASELRQYWKDLVIEETTNIKKNNISEDNISLKVEAKSQHSGAESNVKSDDMKLERNGLHERVKNDNLSRSIKVENMGKNGTIAVQKTTGEKPVKIEKITKEEKYPSQFRPPKLTSMLRCNDELRDKFREIIAEALSKVQSEAPEDIREEVAACDPLRVAVSVESLMFEKLGRSNGAQKAKYRSISFNMKDSKNPDLRRRVLLGQVKPLELINMTAEELASDVRKRQIQQIKDKAIFECERGGPPKATTDQFKCGRCGKRKTTYHQMQTRSADEPMTTYVTCVECNHHWKFC
ncbi:hypothetical protein Taro_019620 [Colocasia esculenta]|uniref:Transcription elongation factor n=1 Tax=Colocasia esculenta TaxID=4460 RepID=A0A843UU29_COLES|nr:hypothetical protein [Colocasia esculenta]